MIAVQVAPPAIVESRLIGGPTPNLFRDALAARLADLHSPDLGVEVGHEVRDGDPDEEIVLEAVAGRCDLIVMARTDGPASTDCSSEASSRLCFGALPVPSLSFRAGRGAELDPVCRGESPVFPEGVAWAVFRVLQTHVSSGEIHDVRHVLPHEIRFLWPRDPTFER